MTKKIQYVSQDQDVLATFWETNNVQKIHNVPPTIIQTPKPKQNVPPTRIQTPNTKPKQNKNKNKPKVKNPIQRPMLKRVAPKRITHSNTPASQNVGLLRNTERHTNSIFMQSVKHSFNNDTPQIEHILDLYQPRREHSSALKLNVEVNHHMNELIQDNKSDYFLHKNYLRAQIPLVVQNSIISDDVIQSEIKPTLTENVLVATKHRGHIPLVVQNSIIPDDVIQSEIKKSLIDDNTITVIKHRIQNPLTTTQEKNMNSCTCILFTNVRDEEHLLEWIAHHKNIGFTHIHIFDHLSKIPVKTRVEHIPNVTVERQDIELTEGVKLKEYFMNIAIHKIAKPNNFSWMLYLDADEFLVLPKYKNVRDFMNAYDDADQIAINWLLFGSNHKDIFENGTLLENFTKCDVRLNQHVKSFVRPIQVIKPINPHAYKINNSQRSVDIKKRKVNKNVPYFVYWGKHMFPDVTIADAYIAHYMYQDYNTYIERKCNLPRDDTGEMREVLTKEYVHSQHNIIENRVPLELYNKHNKELMEHWNIVKEIAK